MAEILKKNRKKCIFSICLLFFGSGFWSWSTNMYRHMDRRSREIFRYRKEVTVSVWLNKLDCLNLNKMYFVSRKWYNFYFNFDNLLTAWICDFLSKSGKCDHGYRLLWPQFAIVIFPCILNKCVSSLVNACGDVYKTY